MDFYLSTTVPVCLSHSVHRNWLVYETRSFAYSLWRRHYNTVATVRGPGVTNPKFFLLTVHSIQRVSVKEKIRNSWSRSIRHLDSRINDSVNIWISWIPILFPKGDPIEGGAMKTSVSQVSPSSTSPSINRHSYSASKRHSVTGVMTPG